MTTFDWLEATVVSGWPDAMLENSAALAAAPENAIHLVREDFISFSSRYFPNEIDFEKNLPAKKEETCQSRVM